ncbi:hypothetical protein TIFTF001_020399 [Ficus carica]|uniref:Uncharacterized protein n=1 Tax=Ficus carica TaxID=3494 RepID=A0AA88DJL2_FICCA|nr:hypothetical protein TIFTF001_020399 [Ficus carica]
MRLTDHSGMGDALWIELSNAKFDNNDDAVKLGLLYLIFCIPLANANSASRAVICNAVENRLSSKRRLLKKADKVHYSIAGFPHALLIWAYESILTITSKFTTKYVEANPRMLSWTSMDNVKFDAVILALTAVGEKHPKCFMMMPTDEELKEQCVAQLYLKNPTVVPAQTPRKTPITQTSTKTNSEWREFQKEIRGQRNVQKDDSDAMKTDSNDLRFGPQDDGFVDSDIDVVADKVVKATMEFLNADKEEGDKEK